MRVGFEHLTFHMATHKNNQHVTRLQHNEFYIFLRTFYNSMTTLAGNYDLLFSTTAALAAKEFK